MTSTRRVDDNVHADPRLLSTITTLAVAILLLARRPSSLFAPQFWAEDGAIFYAQQLTAGALAALRQPYNGYLHVVPRLAGILAAHSPTLLAPLEFALVSYIGAVWACSMFVGTSFRGTIRSDVFRALVCCAFAAVPAIGELMGTLPNVHWYLALATLLLLISDKTIEESMARLCFRCLALFLSVLSAPETVLLTPLATWTLVRTASRACKARAIVFLVGITIQIATYLHSGQSTPPAQFDSAIYSTFAAYTQRVISGTMIGDSRGVAMEAGAALVTLLLAIAAATILLMRLQTARMRLSLLVIASWSWLFIAIYGRNLTGVFPSFGHISQLGERYIFLPAVTYILAIAIILDATSFISVRVKYLAFVLCFIIGCVQNYELQPLTDQHWATYAPEIDAWKTAERLHKPSAALIVPINPSGFTFTLPELH